MEFAKVVVDFGLVVLVWLVQWAIYPSFAFFEQENLKRWHPKYTLGMAWLAAPLMIAQLGLSIYIMTISQSYFIIGNLVLVLATWLVTFIWAVPIHRAIDENEVLTTEIDDLLKVNRIRGWIWTFIFLWTLYIMMY